MATIFHNFPFLKVKKTQYIAVYNFIIVMNTGFLMMKKEKHRVKKEGQIRNITFVFITFVIYITLHHAISMSRVDGAAMCVILLPKSNDLKNAMITIMLDSFHSLHVLFSSAVL